MQSPPASKITLIVCISLCHRLAPEVLHQVAVPSRRQGSTFLNLAAGMQAVLRQGGLVAVLSFLDFFQTGVQRVAVATAAAMCRGLSGDSVEAVQSAVPILTNILQYEVRAASACCATPLHIVEMNIDAKDIPRDAHLDLSCGH